MRNTRPSAFLFLAILVALSASPALAEISISNDWPLKHLNSLSDQQMVAERLKDRQLEDVADQMVAKRNAFSDDRTVLGKHYDQHFMLFVDGVKYYMRGAMFMSKSRPDEVCTPMREKAKDGTDYHCQEGQRLKHSCHLLFMDSDFKDAGVYALRLDEPYEYFCNAMPALGVYDKQRNELLVTVQYFPVDRKLAAKVSDVGSGWKRMTVLFRVKAADGKIQVEQDDTCLKNPNSIETIPDARKELRRCSSAR